MSSFMADLRYALRGLARSPGFAMVAVLTLALGIGANTAMFSVVNQTLLRPPPFDDADRLIMVWQSRPQSARNPASYLDFKDWRDQNRVFESMTMFRGTEVSLSGTGGPRRLRAALVTADFFRTLRIAPVQGRGFQRDEEHPGRDLVAVLSHNLWLTRFGSDPSVIGRSITAEGKSFTVVGIAPPGFRYPEQAELWLPVSHDSPDILESRGLHGYSAIGRLRPSVTLPQARVAMAVIGERLASQYPESNSGTGVTLVPLHEDLVRNLRPTLLVLLGAVGFVLLIATANVANMMLARATARSREIAVRTALGATVGRLARQLLTESLVLAFLGGALGLLLASLSVDVLPVFGISDGGSAEPPRLSAAVLGFTLLLSTLVGIGFGLIPALRAGRPSLNDALADTGRTTGGVHRQRVRGLLVAAEVALSLLLLVGAGLMIRSFVRLQAVNPGFNPHGILTAALSLPPAKYRDTTAVIRFYEQLVDRIQSLPSVTSAAAVSFVPLGNQIARYRFMVDGRPAEEPTKRPGADLLVVTPGYFKTLEIPLLQGRPFSPSDQWATTPVVMINETMAKQFWPGEAPVGKRLSFGDPEDNAWLQIVGVVGDVRYRKLGEEARPQVYAPQTQTGTEAMTLVVRSSGDPLALAGPVERAVLSLDPDQPVSAMQTLERVVGGSIATERSRTWVLGAFAVLALVLAIIGVYGVVAYGVSQRVREIGVRMALGAASADVLRLVVRQGMLMVGTGVLVGIIAAMGLSRVLASLLYQVQPTDPATLLGVAALVLCVALAACSIPARRASRVDPVVALRSE